MLFEMKNIWENKSEHFRAITYCWARHIKMMQRQTKKLVFLQSRCIIYRIIENDWSVLLWRLNESRESVIWFNTSLWQLIIWFVSHYIQLWTRCWQLTMTTRSRVLSSISLKLIFWKSHWNQIDWSSWYSKSYMKVMLRVL